jgi:putative flippase GtrA
MHKIISHILNQQLIRFFLVAGLNTLFGYGMFALLIYIGLHYSMAVLISTIAGVLFNFKTYGLLVFNSKNNKLIFKFILIYIILYLSNIGGIAAFEYFGIGNYIGGMLMLVPVGLLGFLLNKKFVFKTSISNSR